MDIVLHLGAHRTGSTTLQQYLRRNSAALAAGGVQTLLPGMLRGPVFRGLMQPEGQAALATRIAAARQARAHCLLLSEENLGGRLRAHLDAAAIYPALVPRLARVAPLLDQPGLRIGIGIRPLAEWWGSVLAFAVAQGLYLPDGGEGPRLSAAARTWADVIDDVALVFPRATILIWRSDEVAGFPRLQTRWLTGRDDLPPVGRVLRNNAAPDAAELRHRLAAAGQGDATRHLPRAGRWQPFSPAQLCRLAARDAADLARLAHHPRVRLMAAPAFTRQTAPDPFRLPHPPEGGARDGRFGQVA